MPPMENFCMALNFEIFIAWGEELLVRMIPLHSKNMFIVCSISLSAIFHSNPLGGKAEHISILSTFPWGNMLSDAMPRKSRMNEEISKQG